MYRTRGARGEAKLNRTLHESPRHRLASLGNPKKKNVLSILEEIHPRENQKSERHFSFWGSAFQVFRQCGGASIRTRFCENYFLGIRIFAKPRLIFHEEFSRPQKGVWGMNAGRISFLNFWRL